MKYIIVCLLISTNLYAGGATTQGNSAGGYRPDNKELEVNTHP